MSEPIQRPPMALDTAAEYFRWGAILLGLALIAKGIHNAKRSY